MTLKDTKIADCERSDFHSMLRDTTTFSKEVKDEDLAANSKENELEILSKPAPISPAWAALQMFLPNWPGHANVAHFLSDLLPDDTCISPGRAEVLLQSTGITTIHAGLKGARRLRSIRFASSAQSVSSRSDAKAAWSGT